jgi:hypothetical protein
MLVDIYRCDQDFYKQIYQKPLYRISLHNCNIDDYVDHEPKVLEKFVFIGTFDTNEVSLITGHFTKIKIEEDGFFNLFGFTFSLGEYIV